MTLPDKPIEEQENHKAYSEFAVRLIGRVVFCWFLKHKRCDQDRPLIPNELLSSEAVEKHGGYYHSVLEKLFFQTLNKPMNERSKYAPAFAHLIPYLNGGLFDPHKDDFYEEGAMGESKAINTLLIPDDWFRELFQTLEQYNFTIDENTALDADVSIDPEILGRIFENLLAEINPETGDSARKATGSFYTPREIVDYMVEESLLQHLKTALASRPLVPRSSRKVAKNADDTVEELCGSAPLREISSELEQKLRSLFVDDDSPHGLDDKTRRAVVDAFRTIKVLDPACGSGAFPVGILQKMLCALRKVDPENDLWLDAQIAQIHEMKLNKPEENRRLDEIDHAFKTNEADYGRKLGIIQNSVYGVDIQPIAIEISKLRFFLTLVVDEKINEKEDNRGILPLPNLDFKFVCANTLIPAPEIENNSGELDLEYYPDFFDDFTALTEQYFYAGTPKEKLSIREQLSDCVGKKIHGELDKVHSLQGEDLFELHGLSKAKQKKIKEHRAKLVRNINLWESYKNIFSGETVGFFDPKYMFPDASHGFDVVIANPPYGADFSQEEKDFFTSFYVKQSYQLDSYLLFMERGFQLCQKNALVCLIIPNTWLTNLLSNSIRQWVISEFPIYNIIHFLTSVFSAVVDSEVVLLQNRTLEDDHAIHIEIVRDRFVRDTFKIQQRQWMKLSGEPVNILQDPEVFQLTSKIRAFQKLDAICKITQGTKPFQTGKGKPKQTREIVKTKPFVSEVKNNESFRPLLRGKLIRRYVTLWNDDYWISFGEWLAEPRYSAGFDAPQKIVVRQTGDSLIATLDENQFVVRDSLYTILPLSLDVDVKIILGLLNSRLLNWYYQNALNSEKGEALAQVKRGHLARLPIPTATSAQQSEIETRVEKILALKKENPEADVSELEAEIDQLVYKLYDLTEEEVAIVEGKP